MSGNAKREPFQHASLPQPSAHLESGDGTAKFEICNISKNSKSVSSEPFQHASLPQPSAHLESGDGTAKFEICNISKNSKSVMERNVTTFLYPRFLYGLCKRVLNTNNNK